MKQLPMRIIAALLAVSLSESTPSQLPTDARPLEQAEIDKLNQAIIVAKSVADGMGIVSDIAEAAIANFAKIMPNPANPGEAPRVGVNTNPAIFPMGTGAGTLPESVQDGKAVYTSGVGVGEECTLFGPDCIAQLPLIALADTCMHEGMRLKESGADILPPPGGGGGGGGGGGQWEEPLEQKKRRWLRDFWVHRLDELFHLAWKADLLAAPETNPEQQTRLLNYASNMAAWHSDISNDNARRFNRAHP